MSSAPLDRVLRFAATIHHYMAVDEVEKDAIEGEGKGGRLLGKRRLTGTWPIT